METGQLIKVAEVFCDEAVIALSRDLRMTTDRPKVSVVVMHLRKDEIVAIRVVVIDGMSTHHVAKIANSTDVLQDDLHKNWKYLAGGHGQVKFMDAIYERFGRRLKTVVMRRSILNNKFFKEN